MFPKRVGEPQAETHHRQEQQPSNGHKKIISVSLPSSKGKASKNGSAPGPKPIGSDGLDLQIVEAVDWIAALMIGNADHGGLTKPENNTGKLMYPGRYETYVPAPSGTNQG